jgi:hypothetical protein
VEANDVFGHFRFGGGNRRQAIQETEARQRSGAARPMKEISAREHARILGQPSATSTARMARFVSEKVKTCFDPCGFRQDSHADSLKFGSLRMEFLLRVSAPL